jgi:hypothetical protein
LSDYKPLQTVSKIGSEPILEKKDIVEETLQSYTYLQSRFSKNIEFTFEGPKSPIFVMLNPTLHSWTIENPCQECY